MPVTRADIGQQIKALLNDRWSIHVDQVDSYQIPDRPFSRRPRNVTDFRIFVCIYQPIYISVFIHAPTLAALKRKVDAGELVEEIRKEFEKKAVKWQAENEGIEQTQRGLPNEGRQLALTYTPEGNVPTEHVRDLA